jgi:hypothetical protein
MEELHPYSPPMTRSELETAYVEDTRIEHILSDKSYYPVTEVMLYNSLRVAREDNSRA